MKEIQSIVFLLDGYPICGSNACVFARNLIREIADLGIRCTVIAQQIITKETIKKRFPYHAVDTTARGNTVDVYFPIYLYASSLPVFLGLSVTNHANAVDRVIKKEHISFDAVYGHFIYCCGLSAAIVGKKHNTPSFLSVGESDKLMPGNKRNHSAYQVGLKRFNWKELLSSHAGIICVSEWVKKLITEGGFVSNEARIAVYPNGINSDIFHPADRAKIRRELNIT